MKILQDTALTYDDVLLVPQYSQVDSAPSAFNAGKVNEANYFADPDHLSQHGCGDRK